MTTPRQEIRGVVNSILYDAEQDIVANTISVVENAVKEHKDAVAELIKIMEAFHEDAHGSYYSLMMCQNYPCTEAYGTIRRYTGK